MSFLTQFEKSLSETKNQKGYEMPNETDKKFLQQFIEKKRPVTVTVNSFYLIFRDDELKLITASHVRKEDIFLFELSQHDLTYGLSRCQWSTLLKNYRNQIQIQNQRKTTMPNETNKKFLQQFIEKNRPLVCLQGTYQIIFRGVNLMIVKSKDLRIGDIRLLEMDAVDFVKGLSDFQWMSLLTKFQTMSGIVEYMTKNEIPRLTE